MNLDATYEELLAAGQRANRLNAIGQLQSNLLNSMREQNFMFQIGGVNFVGEDSVRVRAAIIRELEAMSQEGRKELEALGVTFPKPATQPRPPEASEDEPAKSALDMANEEPAEGSLPVN